MSGNNSKIYLLIFVGMLASLGPFVTDFYLPALPALNTFFGATASMTQLSLTFCMLGLAVGQIFIGPISDRAGRRGPLFVTLVLFVLSTGACILSWDIESFVMFRFIQGLSGAGGIVISKSIVVDLYKGRELAKFYMLLSLVQAIAPVVSPILGGALLNITDWKGIFFVLVLIELTMLVMFFSFRESLPEERRSTGKIVSNFGSYAVVFRNARFMSYVSIQSLSMGVMFAYIASSPFIFQEIYGLSPFVYSLCFGINAVGIMLGNIASTRIYSAKKGLFVGSRSFTAVGVLSATAIALRLPFAPVEILLFCLMLCLGIILPTSTALAMDLERKNSGTASAVLGCMTFLAGGLASPVTGLGDMLYSTAAVFVVCCTGIVFFTQKALGRSRMSCYSQGSKGF